ncbi:MAG: hypothetical protein Q7S89_00030 [bacterium]|nr:hypothetical protein [bacterium]
MAKLTLAQAEQLVSLLNILADPENQPWDPAWGESVFSALTHVITPVSIEIVALRRGLDGHFEVFLTQRPNTPSEPYPGQWHSPGTYVYANDRSVIYDQRRRLEMWEVEPAYYADITYAGRTETAVPPRGRSVQLVHCARLDGEPAHGAFFSFEALPEPFHHQHREIILIAINKAEQLGWQLVPPSRS